MRKLKRANSASTDSSVVDLEQETRAASDDSFSDALGNGVGVPGGHAGSLFLPLRLALCLDELNRISNSDLPPELKHRVIRLHPINRLSN